MVNFYYNLKDTAVVEGAAIDERYSRIKVNVETNVDYITSDGVINTVGDIQIYDGYLLVKGNGTNIVIPMIGETLERANSIAEHIKDKVGITTADSDIVKKGIEITDLVDYYMYSRFGITEGDTYKFEASDFDTYNLVNKDNSDDHIVVMTPYETIKCSNEDDKTINISGVEFKYNVEARNKYSNDVKIYIESLADEGMCMCFSKHYVLEDYPTEEEQVADFVKIMEQFVNN